MDSRTLGKTGLQVSALGFGCGNVGGLMVRGTPADRERAIARALELGITYFDTAPAYGNGLSEQHLGQVVKALKVSLNIGTKVRLTSADLGDIAGAIRHSLDASLQRLGMEQVTLLQLHNHIAQTQDVATATVSVQNVLHDVMPTLQALQQQGKIRFYGITALGETAALHQVIDAGVLHTAQVCYNLLNPSAGYPVPTNFPAQDFQRLFDHTTAHQVGCIGIRALAAGALSGVTTRHPVAVPSVDPIASGADYHSDVQRAQLFQQLLQQGYIQDLVEASLRFAISQPGLATVLLGYSSIEHLEYAAAAVNKGPLPAEALNLLGALWERLAAGR